MGLVTQIETSPWGDVVVTVVTISASASKLSTKMDSISSILDNNEVVSSVSAVNDEDSLRTLMVKTEAIKLSTGEKRFIFSAVPSASPQNSGAMSPDVFVAFQEAQRNIANLFSSLAGLPRTVVQAGIGMTPTQEELTAAFAEAMEDQPRVNDRFVNVDSKTEFIFDTEEIWQSLSGETIGLATETNSGYVQHSDLDGYISYFVAGVGRVNGWEALKAAVATNAANIATKQNALNRTIGSNDDATGTVTDTGGNLSIPIALTVAAPSPSSSQTTATAVDAPRTLRAQLKTLIDNIAYLFTNAVMLAGTQTIAGTKTFSSAPIITTPSTSSNRAVRYDQVAGIAASPPLTPVSVNITSASYGDIPISGYRLLVTVEPTGSAYYQLTARFVYSGIVPVGTRIFMIIVRPGWNTGSNSWNFNLILKDDSSESVIVSRISTGHNVNGQTSFVMVDALRTPQGWMFFN
ncbi:MAG: hypothetical protein FWF63_02650 [Fibromonadales bacterium]|nr:hypothetical protein [Fibromonadales bacterium]